jgi:16S rRNA (guanine527-N7)-methyltransferase
MSADVDELVRRYGLVPQRGGQVKALLDQIERDTRAPTAVRDPVIGVDRHVADSLVALDIDTVRGAETIADIGSGVGFPGLALAVALSGCEVRLVESRGRKCAFLEHVIAQAAIENARVVCARAEQWKEGLAANDVVTARAVGPQPVVLEYAAPLLRMGGMLVDWRGKRDPEEELRAGAAAEELGLSLVAIERVRPFAEARDRHLHLYEKAKETPTRFPRRAGMARKRPLGAD